VKFNGKVRYESPGQAPSTPKSCPKCQRKLQRTGVSERRGDKHEFKSFYCQNCLLTVQVHYYDGRVVEINQSMTTVERK
jgi:alpha-galactosidase